MTEQLHFTVWKLILWCLCPAYLLPFNPQCSFTIISHFQALPLKRITGRKARGLQKEEIGCKCQTFFSLSLKEQEETLSMEMFFLSYVNETIYLLWNLPFFKMVPPKTNFFLFSNLGLIIAQQTSIHINCFTAGGWHTLRHPISKTHIVGERPGEPPSGLSYLSFLTDTKQLVKTSGGSTLHAPSAVYVRSFLCPLLYFNKTLLHKSPWVIKPGPWSRS